MRAIKLFGLSVAFLCATAHAGTFRAADSWVLDNESSSLAFVTTKLDNIAEVLSFKQLSGELQADGSASVSIDVDSLDAIFEIRDDRMKEHLFKMVDFAVINISAQIDMGAVADIADGETANMAIETTMTLLGTEHQVPAEVLVTNTGTGIVVSSAKPVLLNATTLGLDEGIVKLAELAGGIEISRAVPVSFTLSFN